MAKFEFKEKNKAYEVAVYTIMTFMIIFAILLIAAIVKGVWFILFKL
jgi:hypothetical protein